MQIVAYAVTFHGGVFSVWEDAPKDSYGLSNFTLTNESIVAFFSVRRFHNVSSFQMSISRQCVNGRPLIFIYACRTIGLK